MTDWVGDWMTGRSADWVTGQLIVFSARGGRLTDRLVGFLFMHVVGDWLNQSVSHWLADWLIGQWIAWLDNEQGDWLVDCPTYWLTGMFIVPSCIDWLTWWLDDQQTDWLIDGLVPFYACGDWLIDWLNGDGQADRISVLSCTWWMTELLIDCMCHWLSFWHIGW